MLSSVKNKLNRFIQVDKFAIGGNEKGKQGRSSSIKKVKIVLGCEIVEKKVGTTFENAYSEVIEN
jgi:hypothetical protein